MVRIRSISFPRHFLICLSFSLLLPIYALGQDTNEMKEGIATGTPPQYEGKHFALGMYEALYNATSQTITETYNPEYYVELGFYVNEKGRCDSVFVNQSTGYDYLDRQLLQLSKRFAKRHKKIKPAFDDKGQAISSTVLLPMSLHLFLPPSERSNGKNVGKNYGEGVYNPSSQWYWSVKNGTDDNYKGLYWPGKVKSP